jgi:hypothetical protein
MDSSARLARFKAALEAAVAEMKADGPLTAAESDDLVSCLLGTAVLEHDGLAGLVGVLAAFAANMAARERDVLQDQGKAAQWERLAQRLRRLPVQALTEMSP